MTESDGKQEERRAGSDVITEECLPSASGNEISVNKYESSSLMTT